MKFDIALIALLGFVSVNPTLSFGGIKAPLCQNQRSCLGKTVTFLASTPEGGAEPETSASDSPDAEVIEFASDEAKKEAVGNLVEEDEWGGLTLELSELIRLSVIEDLKKNTKEFLGKDDYKIGDISKEIDVRVKTEVTKLRGKEDGEYELGDLVLAMDKMSKEMTEGLTGKPYEAGDLSLELDTRIKGAVASYCGKETYEVGDLTNAVTSRVSSRVEEFTGTGKPYEFGDVTNEVWVQDLLGAEAAENYQFGDITKKAMENFTGKDYEFGDVSKKLFGNLFGGKKK
jgi:hypothetical protein